MIWLRIGTPLKAMMNIHAKYLAPFAL